MDDPLSSRGGCPRHSLFPFFLLGTGVGRSIEGVCSYEDQERFLLGMPPVIYPQTRHELDQYGASLFICGVALFEDLHQFTSHGRYETINAASM